MEQVVLQAKVLDLGEPKAILALAPSPPNIDDLERTIVSLKEVCTHPHLHTTVCVFTPWHKNNVAYFSAFSRLYAMAQKRSWIFVFCALGKMLALLFISQEY